MKTKLLISCIVIVLVGQPAFAMRCKNTLVREGMRPAEVINRCGEPDYVEESVEYRTGAINNWQTGRYFERERPIKIEEWTYNFGPRRFMRLLRFADGRLLSIESLGYGYWP